MFAVATVYPNTTATQVIAYVSTGNTSVRIELSYKIYATFFSHILKLATENITTSPERGESRAI